MASNILFATSGALEDVTVDVGEPFYQTSTNYYDQTYSKLAIGTSTETARGFRFSLSSKVTTEVWGLFYLYTSASMSTGSGYTGINFLDGTTEFLRIRCTSTNKVGVQKYASSTWTTIAETSPALDMLTSEGYYAFRVKFHGTTGEVQIWFNNTEYMNATGLDTLGDTGATGVDGFTCRGTSSALYYSQIVIADGDTRDMRAAAITPNAAGTTSGFTGAYTAIDEADINMSDFISSGTANQVSTFGASDLPADSRTPIAVILSTMARRGTTGPANLQLALRSSGTDYFSTSKSLETGFSKIGQVQWTTNPAGGDWTTSAVNALEIGVKSIT